MTQEEKARAYDEAIERAKELMKKGYFVLMPEIFPELAESEDEKIRKALIDFFQKKVEKSFEWVEYGIPNNDVLAYLEKQKEQPTDAKLERVIKAARRVLNNWLDGTDCPDVSGDFAELEFAFREYDKEVTQ